MSKENSRLIINCGSTHISATVFSYDGKQLKIEKSHSVSLDYDYQDDEAWLDAVDVGIKEIIRVGKFSGKANFIIPGNQVLAKTLLLPTVAQNKQAQVLAFEAQHNLPYDLDEVVWDGEAISNDGIESEILLGACKADMANEFCEIIRQSGLLIESINASTILSYSALKASQPEVEDDILLINVGARSSNLFFKNEEGFFVRTINYGGNTLTQFISDTLGKGFSESDEIKRRFFAEEGGLDEESSAYKLMQTCIANFSRRFAQEVKRSIVMYRRQKGADAIKRIFITGKGAQSEFIRNKISENLEQDIELFNPLDGVELPANLAVDAENLNIEMSEVVGEAIKEFNLIENYGNLNLVPLNVKQELKFIRQKPILAVAALLLALFPWFIFSGISKSSDLKGLALKELKQFAQPYQSNEALIGENQAKAKMLSQSISQVEGLVETKTNWIQFFADIQESIYDAKDVWIDDLTVIRQNEDEDPFEDAYGYSDYEESDEVADVPDYEVVVKGKMLVRQSASEINQDVLADRIKQIKASFEDSNFVVASKQPKISWKYLSDGLRVLPFEINLIIDTEKPL
jgi:type IV pilus assembly protein PilM